MMASDEQQACHTTVFKRTCLSSSSTNVGVKKIGPHLGITGDGVDNTGRVRFFCPPIVNTNHQVSLMPTFDGSVSTHPNTGKIWYSCPIVGRRPGLLLAWQVPQPI